MVFVVKVDQNFKFVYDFLNRAAMEGTGFTQSVAGKSIQEVYPKEKAAFLCRKYKKVVTNREVVSYEDTFITTLGKKYYSSTKLTPLLNEKKECTQIVAVVKDISKEKTAELERKEALDRLNESKKQYHSLFYHNSDAIISFDPFGYITNGNVAVESVTGYSPTELVGSTLNSLVVTEDAKQLNKLFMQAIDGTTENSLLAILNKAGERIDVSLKVTPIIIDEKVIGVSGVLRDITKKLKTAKKLEESEERFRIIAEHAEDLITLINDKGEMIYTSPSYKEILGFSHKEYIGKLFLHNVHSEYTTYVSKQVLEAIKNGEKFNVQFKQYNNEDEAIWFESHGTPVFDSQRKLKHMVVLSRNINLLKEYEKRLKHFALHDSLTGLPNRYLFKERLTQALTNFQEKKDGLAVVMLDIDHFKKINDEFGHDTGDGVIEEFGKRISRTITDRDTVARLGGDEFVVLLPSIGSDDNAIEIVENIQKVLQRSWNINDNLLKVTASIGIAFATPKPTTIFSILKQADIALYEAKNMGRNAYKIMA